MEPWDVIIVGGGLSSETQEKITIPAKKRLLWFHLTDNKDYNSSQLFHLTDMY